MSLPTIMRRRWRFGLLGLCLTTIILTISHGVSAQTAYPQVPLMPAGTISGAPGGGGATISPFLSEVTLTPDSSTRDVPFHISNTSSQDETFDLSAVDFGTLDTTGGLAFSGANVQSFIHKYGLAQWIQLSPQKLTVAAGQTATATATISNDDTLGPGGHYAAVIMTLDNPPDTRQDTVTVQQKISALVFATKAGGEVYDMKLASVNHDGNWHHVPGIFVMRFHDSGNVQVVPRGSVQLYDPLGHQVSTGTINEGSAYALPESTREIVAQTHPTAPAWLPGRYRINVDYRYDGNGRFVRRTMSFTYWSPVVLAAVLAFLAGAAYGLIRLRRYRHVLIGLARRIKPHR